MAKIKITYDTGSTFHSESGVEDYLEVYDPATKKSISEFPLDVCERNLNRIKKHYEFYGEYNYGRNRAYSNRNKLDNLIEELNNKYKEEDWFIKMEQCGDEHSLMLEYSDNHFVRVAYPFWLGYFERLCGAEIELNKIKF